MPAVTVGFGAALVSLASVAGPAVQPPGAPLAERVQAVLKAYCHRCHGAGGMAKGGFGHVLDLERLVARGQVVAGNAPASELYQRVQSGEMPPPGKQPRPGPDQMRILRDWIAAGAPGLGRRRPAFVREGVLQRHILDDLQALPPRQRRFSRYFTLTHLANAGLDESDLDRARAALARLVNSLSWHPRISRPTPVDPTQTVYRIDLRHYRWTPALWDRLASAYPYRLRPATPEVRAIAAATGSDMAYVRADWFLATASRAPVYYDLLQLPGTDRGLERLLQVDVPGGLRDETAMRAGFNGSGVSRNNRLIERHDAANGTYWRSYDFAGTTGRQDLFEHPLGPATGATSFAHAGGEIIFHLPNGLFGYMLIDAQGRRVDRAPIEIVSDPGRPDRRVQAGLSCMSCHARGLLFKADQVRAHVEKNRGAFTPADLEAVRALYAPGARLRSLLEEDNDRYRRALARAASAEGPDPVNEAVRRFEGILDGRAAAAELGLPAKELNGMLGRSPALARLLGPLRTAAGTVQRQLFEDSFADAVRGLGIDRDNGALTQADRPSPFLGHDGPVLGLAFSADGRWAVSGGADRTVRLWDAGTGQQHWQRRAHAGEVSALAFAADGKSVVSAGGDRTVAVWETATGKALRRLRGPTDRVRALAMSADGRLVAAGGDDRAVYLWGLSLGEVPRVLTGHAGPVSALTFAPDGRLLSASHDGTVRLWHPGSAREVGRFEGHRGQVYGLAVSHDGRRLLSGGSDRTVRLWDVASGCQLKELRGHANPVIAVRFTADGRRALSGSSRYRAADRAIREWDLGDGRELRSWAGGEDVSIACLALAPGGRAALTASAEGVLRLWHWSE